MTKKLWNSILAYSLHIKQYVNKKEFEVRWTNGDEGFYYVDNIQIDDDDVVFLCSEDSYESFEQIYSGDSEKAGKDFLRRLQLWNAPKRVVGDFKGWCYGSE